MTMDDYRRFLKADAWYEWGQPGTESDQQKGVPMPPVQKPFPADARRLALVAPDALQVGSVPLIEAIRGRRSRRRFSPDPLTLEELSFLLWATQGVRERVGPRAFRTVPSGGCRHAFETYMAVASVDGVDPGLYRYLPLEHELLFLRSEPDLPERMAQACRGQRFVADAAVTLVWTAIPYRMEWRYTIVSHKVIALDAGHVCQNLYLAAEAIGAGTCAIAAYDQREMDALLEVDGVEEFAVYAAPVGKPS